MRGRGGLCGRYVGAVVGGWKAGLVIDGVGGWKDIVVIVGVVILRGGRKRGGNTGRDKREPKRTCGTG